MINQQDLKKSKIVQLTQLNLLDELNGMNKMSTQHAQFLGHVMDNNYGIPSTWFENIVSNDTLIDPENNFQKATRPEIKNKSNQLYYQPDQRHNPVNLKNPNLFKIDVLLIGLEICIAYGVSLAFFALTLLHQFPYFEVIIIICFLFLLCPNLKNISIMDCFILLCIPCCIINNYIGVRNITYLEILIFYFSVSLCKKNKKYIKLGFIAIVFFIFGIQAYLILPNLYYAFGIAKAKIAFYYLFPFFLYLTNILYNFLYLYIGYPSPVLYQTSYFIAGLEYGIILTLSFSEIQFWFLLIITNLLLIQQRLLLTVRLYIYCFDKKHRQLLLLRVNSGYHCMYTFQLIILIYLFCYTPFYYAPYSSSFSLSSYVKGQPYKPALVWAMRSIYQLVSFLKAHKKQNLIICGHLFYTPLAIGFRIVCLIFGIWLFYIGLAAGKYITL